MSGHSKWSTIKRKKEITDKARGLQFSKLARVITLAVSEGGGIADPAFNIKLRVAIERGRAINMPKANIDRAIEKAKGPDASALKEVVYEGFGPAGSLLIITATTDNQNRTFSNVKNTLEKAGGKLGSENSVKYQFTKCGVVEFEPSVPEDSVYEFADRVGALDIEQEKEGTFVYIPFDALGSVQGQLQGLQAKSIDIFYKPHMWMTVSHEDAVKIEGIVELLEEQDEVDAVYTNHSL